MKPVKLLKRLNNLKRMPRTGWLFCGVPLNGVEDVAQHSFEVAAITMLLADEINSGGKKVDGARAIRMAIFHDWAEAEVTDFPYTALKYLKNPGEKKDTERRALEDMLRDSVDKANYLALWDEYNEKLTIESKLVHAADYLSMLVQAVKYRESGIRSMELDELWRAVKRDLVPYAKELNLVAQMVKELEGNFSL